MVETEIRAMNKVAIVVGTTIATLVSIVLSGAIEAGAARPLEQSPSRYPIAARYFSEGAHTLDEVEVPEDEVWVLADGAMLYFEAGVAICGTIVGETLPLERELRGVSVESAGVIVLSGRIQGSAGKDAARAEVAGAVGGDIDVLAPAIVFAGASAGIRGGPGGVGGPDGDGGVGGAVRVVSSRMCRTRDTAHLAVEVGGGRGGVSGKATRREAPVPRSGDAGGLALELPTAANLERWGLSDLSSEALDELLAGHL